MASRLVVFVLAFAIVGAPVAADVCHVRCAPRAADATGEQADHHACAPSVPADAPGVSAVPHACGHQSGDTVGVEQALHGPAAPSGPVALQAVVTIDIVTVRALVLDTARRPGPPHSSVQLRV